MRRLFVLSVDSLFFDDMAWLAECPNLQKILKNGSQVQKIRSVYPAMTYVAHSTMLTGCYPDVHGIYHNEKVQIDNPYPDWHWRREALKVPTVIDAAKPLGYRFCVVNWPVTGADPNIDYNIPEIWSRTTDGDSRPRFLSVCSPGIAPLFDKYRHLLRWKYQPELDEFGICCLSEVIEAHQPEVIMLHLSYLDASRHAYGVFAPAAKNALIAVDQRFGRIVAQLERLGLYDQTDFVVLGDHGHLPVKQVFNPNVIFRERGLITLDAHGRVKTWKAYCHSAGLSAHVVLADPTDANVRRQVLEILEGFTRDEAFGCEQILDKATLKTAWHLDGPFDYAIEGRLGTAFGNACQGPRFLPTDNRDYKLSVASHGHMPTKGPQPTMFLAGPHVRKGVVMENCDMIDQAPTWAALLGAQMPEAQGQVLRQLICE